MIDQILALLPKFEMCLNEEELARFRNPETMAEAMIQLYAAIMILIVTVEELIPPIEKLQVLLREADKLEAAHEAEKLTCQWLLEHIKL